MSLSKKLIVNADGFGFGAGATKGILEALRRGQFISSISVTVNFPDVERIDEVLKEFPHVSIGVHLNAMVGRPCLPSTEVPSLVGPSGAFHAKNFKRLLRSGAIAIDELEAEFDAQIRKIKELTRGRLTHLDSHANSHLSYLDLFLRLARKWGLYRMRNNASLICLEAPNPRLSRLRVYSRKPHVWLMHQYRRGQMYKARCAGMRMADDLVTVGYAGRGNKANRENWLWVLRNLPPGTHEIYCHPAYTDNTLVEWSYYREERVQELEILSCSELCNVARAEDVNIISFYEV